ncbi:hypothetical protein DUT90_11610 [Polaribacter sp. WD7]|uniref:hypothetical protein n=1 Tax=Polaribacter sp. WD7 TaxID=2269061 RepID=UPI000DF2B98F|nr:hypothetical protein [Polaribacter sp. WD7]RCS26402.1 hypothetical protein DUT90_11610 [Polaribacter sp. WD7]
MKKVIMTIMAAAFIVSCDVNQTKKTKLPEVEVDVETEAGQLPSYNVEWADINVGTTTKKVTVPKIVVITEEVEVEVPYVDVDMPNDNNNKIEKEEKTVLVEVEVDENMHEIDIKEIRASQNNLVVISELEAKNQTLGDKKIRISDQITLNAPDLNVKHYIVGEKPDRVFNSQHKYFETMEEVDEALQKDYKVIYSK